MITKNEREILSVKPGTVITFVYGPSESADPKFASHKGRAYGVRRTRFGVDLRVKMDDFTFEYVSSFTQVGIGAYLWPKPEPLLVPACGGSEPVTEIKGRRLLYCWDKNQTGTYPGDHVYLDLATDMPLSQEETDAIFSRNIS